MMNLEIWRWSQWSIKLANGNTNLSILTYNKMLDVQMNMNTRYIHEVSKVYTQWQWSIFNEPTNDFHCTLSIYSSLRACACASSRACASSSWRCGDFMNSIPWLLIRNLLCLYQFWIQENLVQPSLQDKINHKIITSKDSYIKVTSYKFAIKKVAMIYEEIERER
jgi:hypothetical protein